ncbi:50S ribosomal protein L5 [Candidatus Woesebacteria bacterium RBG_19FT_COMBO_47_8]|uniref:Large ribosomal subunit protein uL5 n=1 Tax=Candidatus Woesebacteria bacterium RBG_13_46_13 TaxID=1802479 RepID=A0A1F7X5C1_9BACT|nr:MAG: 50S ribosomal protein L5 [Candidatus Woesebacteria bacterium RBG_13_46_13]OGM16748.1 MAG: 50S ribosomal protein L5 [Candidatus Woesebacteria bacterium RBG_19FT_COMBO_47_8]HJX59155.1 50S ribosomal protein L5 [Patescibacteria group bacterium]
MSRLKEKYQKEVMPVLTKEFEIKNSLEVPRVEKIVVNTGLGEMIKDKNLKDIVSKELAAITGQIPSVKVAKVSIAAFGLRAGMPVGLTVTLRGEKMYDFLDKLVSITLPRLRDFRGVPLKSFDVRGNYTLGIVEHTVFPEIDLSKGVTPRGMEVSIVTNAGTPERAKRLLELLGMPFEKQ